MCTLVVYSLIIFNAVNLFKAFSDNSKQDEKIQTSKSDRWYSDAYKLHENDIDISLVSIMPESFGTMRMYQTFDCLSNNLDVCRDLNGADFTREIELTRC